MSRDQGLQKKLNINIDQLRSSRSLTRPILRVSYGGHYFKDKNLAPITTDLIDSPPSVSSSSLLGSFEEKSSVVYYGWPISGNSQNNRSSIFNLLTAFSITILGAKLSSPNDIYSSRTFAFPITEHSLLFDSVSISIFENCFISGYRLIANLLLPPPLYPVAPHWELLVPRSGSTSKLMLRFSISIVNDEVFCSEPEIESYNSALPFSELFDDEPMDIIESPIMTQDKFPFWIRPLSSILDENTVNLGLRVLLKLYYSFGQGLEDYSHPALFGALVIMYRFEAWKRRKNLSALTTIYREKEKYCRNQRMVSFVHHIYKFAFSAYGWKGLTFMGRRSLHNILSNPSSEKQAILSYLNIKECDILHITESNKLFQPHCVIFYDVRSDDQATIVVALRGSLSAFDWITSFGGEYLTWNEGLVHSGVAKSAEYVIENILPIAISYADKLGVSKIIFTGHSLGGAIALLSLLFYQHQQDEAFDDKGARISFEAYSFGSPPIVSIELLPLFSNLKAVSFIFGNDVIPRLSCGSLMDYRSLIIRATSYVSLKNLFNPVSVVAYIRLSRMKKQSLKMTQLALYTPGQVYYIYDIENGTPTDPPSSPTSPSVVRNITNPARFDRYTILTECDPLLFGQFCIQPFMIAHHNPIAYDDAIYNASQKMEALFVEKIRSVRDFLHAGPSRFEPFPSRESIRRIKHAATIKRSSGSITSIKSSRSRSGRPIFMAGACTLVEEEYNRTGELVMISPEYPLVSTLDAHTSPTGLRQTVSDVVSCDVNENPGVFFSCGYDSLIKCWQVDDEARQTRLQATWKGHRDRIHSMSRHTSDLILASASQDGSILLWPYQLERTFSSRPVSLFKSTPKHGIPGLVQWGQGPLSENLLFSLTSYSPQANKGLVHIWDGVLMKSKAILRSFSGGLSTLCCNSEGLLLAVAGGITEEEVMGDGILRIFDIRSVSNMANPVFTIPTDQLDTDSVFFSPSSSLIASGQGLINGAQIKVFDLRRTKDRNPLFVLNHSDASQNQQNNGSTVVAHAWTLDGKLITGAADSCIRFWDLSQCDPELSDWKLVADSPISALSLGTNSDDSIMLVGSESGSLSIYSSSATIRNLMVEHMGIPGEGELF